MGQIVTWSVRDETLHCNSMIRLFKDFIKENPGHFIHLAGKKFVRFWRLWPYAEKYNKTHFIVISILSYGLVLFAFIHFLLFYMIDKWRIHIPIILFIIFLTFVHMITIGSIRYRFPLEPFIIIYGCYSISQLFGKFHNKNGGYG